MARPGVEMGLNALSDRRFVAPGDHGVEKPIAASTRQILVAEAFSKGARRVPKP
jgi:hypothetical protein